MDEERTIFRKINSIVRVVGQDILNNEGRKVVFIDCLLSESCCGRNVYLWVSLNFLYQNFREHTNSNNHCRMQLRLLHNCVYSWILASTKHMFVLHNGALGSDKQQRINITGQKKKQFFSPTLPPLSSIPTAGNNTKHFIYLSARAFFP